jgi:uncharacterized heparinase superfamily protein
MKLQHQLAVASRYIRTLRHLRLSQLRGQVITRLKKQWRDPAKMLAGQPASWELSLHSMELDLCPPVPAQDAEALSRGTFCFVNQTANLGFPVDWSAKGMPRLWSYNLHYFDWLWSFLHEGSKTEDERWENAKRLTHDWMINHPPSKTAEGWEPYPVSSRLINWSLLYGVKHRDLVQQDEAFKLQLLESIGRQVKWLELNLETHIQANHLLENLAALVCVACVFEGDEANRVLSRYLPMLNREIDEQFLADGMHYERSPMYHLRVLWLVEMLGAVGSPEVQAVVSEVGGKMKLALAMLRHPDGGIALFNDAAHSIYHDAWKDNETELGSWALDDAGYYGFRDEDENYLIVDAGPIGPDYQPGHAHADYLSFELSMHGNRMITDTGIATYHSGERRSYDRSTAAHSTVEIAGQNSAEVWGGFRVGRRVAPEVLVWVEGGEFQLKAKQTGYRYLPCQAEHTRRLKWCDGGLEIQDSIQATQETGAVSRLHFSSECELTVGSGEVQIDLAGRQYRCLVEGDCEILLERHPSCLEFAMDEDRSVLVMKHRVGVGETTWKVRIEPALQAMAEE